MPLTELMNYFNDQLQQRARIQALPKTGFFKVNNAYWARFGNLILGTRLNPLRDINSGEQLGFDAELLTRTTTANLLNIDDVFNALDEREQIIHLDRLVRTLHSLNYLQQHDERRDLLSLSVHPRHIISVDTDHGKTFEKILSDCGLGPERVLLTTRLLSAERLAHFSKALGSYRQHGYLVGVSLNQHSDIQHLQKLSLPCDALFIDNPQQHSAAREFSRSASQPPKLLVRTSEGQAPYESPIPLEIPAQAAEY